MRGCCCGSSKRIVKFDDIGSEGMFQETQLMVESHFKLKQLQMKEEMIATEIGDLDPSLNKFQS